MAGLGTFLQLYAINEALTLQPNSIPSSSVNTLKNCPTFLRITLLPNGTLKIANVTRRDAASYTCIAKNQFGTATTTGRLLITGKSCTLLSQQLPINWTFTAWILSFFLNVMTVKQNTQIKQCLTIKSGFPFKMCGKFKTLWISKNISITIFLVIWRQGQAQSSMGLN